MKNTLFIILLMSVVFAFYMAVVTFNEGIYLLGGMFTALFMFAFWGSVFCYRKL